MKINIAEQDYRAIGRESFSSLKYLLESPEEYVQNKKIPFEGSDATRLGTAIHMFLQGDGDQIKILPVIKKKLKDGSEGKFDDKEAINDFIKANKGQHFITESQMEIVQEIYNNAKNRGVLKLLDNYIFEQAYLFERNGIKFKGRLDADNDIEILDIKTTSKSVAWRSFKHIIDDSHYDMQAAMYQAAHGKNAKYKILAVQTTWPYTMVVYTLSQKTLDSGYTKWDKCINRLANLDYLLNSYVEDEI